MGVLRTELPRRDGMKQFDTEAHIKLDGRGTSGGRVVLHEFQESRAESARVLSPATS